MKKIISKLRLGDIEIPNCIKEQIVKFYLLAIIVFIIGMMLTIISFNWFILIAAIILPLIIAGIGYYRAYEISHNGYHELIGKCTRVEYTLSSRVGGNATRDVPKRYLVTVGDRTYAIPYFKQNPLMNEGDQVKLYVRDKEDTFEWKSIHTPSMIYGYEVMYKTEQKKESPE